MAKISIMSDLHLGFKRGTEREEDAFIATERAFEKVVDMESDIVVVAGDIFDSRLPRPEHWSRFMNILSPLGRGEVEVSRTRGRKGVPEEAVGGIPVVAIHGTHERRTNRERNSIGAMEDAGFLVHLHCSSVELDVKGEKIGIHGMGGVPEKYSKEVLKKWDPEPFDDAYNIFVIHQDLEEYIYNPVRPPELGLEDLPGGFDLYVSGHIHWKDRQKVNGSPFLIPGSLIPTQLKKRESETPKGFYTVSTQREEVEFVEIEAPRKFVYKKMEFEDADTRTVEKKVSLFLEDIQESERKPLVRIKAAGDLQKGISPADVNLSKIGEKYREKALVSFSEDLKEKKMNGGGVSHENIHDRKLSVEEMGMGILQNKLEETGVDISPDVVFEDLVQGNIEAAMDKIQELDREEDKGGQTSKEEDWWIK